MQLICKKWRRGLTVGAMYTEILPYPNAFNCCVTNDEGEPEHYPRDEFFNVVEEA